MVRLIAATFLLLTLFIATTPAAGSGACVAVPWATEAAAAPLQFEPAETVADESQEQGLSAEHTDWPVLSGHAAHPSPHLPQAWPHQPVLALRSADAAPTPPPPRSHA